MAVGVKRPPPASFAPPLQKASTAGGGASIAGIGTRRGAFQDARAELRSGMLYVRACRCAPPAVCMSDTPRGVLLNASETGMTADTSASAEEERLTGR